MNWLTVFWTRGKLRASVSDVFMYKVKGNGLSQTQKLKKKIE